jgi:hypothetical protein
MIGKRALVAIVTLVVFSACAKNVITLKPKPVAKATPVAVQKVAVAATPAIEPVVAEVLVVESTPTSVEVTPAEPVEEIVLASLPVEKPTLKKKLKRITDAFAPTTAKPTVVAELHGCDSLTGEGIPTRTAAALPGSQVAQQSMALSGTARDTFLADQLMDGNLPPFLRTLTPVTFTGKGNKGDTVEVTICVTPDYLAVGDDQDFVRVPMGLPAAAEVANALGFFLPTTKMVDAIYSQAGLRLSPSPMTPGSQMSSTDYLRKHNQTVETQRHASRSGSEVLVAGQKKDLVLSNVLRSTPGRVAIYGWHRPNGVPIQPLSTVHGETYADYSHGIRLVSATAFVNGEPYPLAKLLEDPIMASFISKEGPINSPVRLMASISVN